MGKVVVDANVLIGYLNRDPRAVLLIETLVARSAEIIIPAVVIAEILSFPRLTEPERAVIRDFVLQFIIFPVNLEIAELAGLIRTQYPIKLPDALIAATAQFLAAPLCTFDTADFRKITVIEIFDLNASL